MSKITVNINGIPANNLFIEGLDDFSVSHDLDENGNEMKKVSNTLVWHGGGVTGSPFEIFKADLIDDPEGKNKSIPVEFFDNCCGDPKSIFKGVVKGDSLRWCDGQCFIEAEAIEDDTDDRALDCLESTLIFDNRNGFQSQVHPRVTYCNELRPNWLHDVILILGIIVNIIQLILIPVVSVVAFVIALFTLGAAGGLSLINDYIALIPALKEAITGCGRQHPSPIVTGKQQV